MLFLLGLFSRGENGSLSYYLLPLGTLSVDNDLVGHFGAENTQKTDDREVKSPTVLSTCRLEIADETKRGAELSVAPAARCDKLPDRAHFLLCISALYIPQKEIPATHACYVYQRFFTPLQLKSVPTGSALEVCWTPTSELLLFGPQQNRVLSLPLLEQVVTDSPARNRSQRPNTERTPGESLTRRANISFLR